MGANAYGWIPVRAGPLTAEIDGTSVRRIRLGSVVVVDHIYVAVRDEQWNTIPGIVTGLEVDQSPRGFEVRFECRHTHGDMDFGWMGRLAGTRDGSISCTMDGTSLTSFRFCRIGFNVQLGAAAYAGRRFQAWSDGEPRDGLLPVLVGPQALRDGSLRGLTDPFDRLSVDLGDGLGAMFAFSGDDFEIEDQRNFGESSFKVYSTPLASPWPFDSDDGDVLRQSLLLTVEGPTAAARRRSPDSVRIGIGPRLEMRMPRIGFGWAPAHGPLSEREVTSIRATRPSHLRVDVSPISEEAPELLRRASADAVTLGAGLEIALHVDEDASIATPLLRELLEPIRGLIDVVLVFTPSRGAYDVGSNLSAVASVRQELETALPGVPIGGGSNAFFASVNRTPPRPQIGVLAFPISPTVHLRDDAAIFEGLTHLGDAISTAASAIGDVPVRVTPITIATRNGPYPGGPPGPSDLPASVDGRQSSLIGAAWTVGAIAALAQAGADALTFYELVGWKGVIERDGGSPRPDRFSSVAGGVYPMWHVFATTARFAGADVVTTVSSDAWRAVALSVIGQDGHRVLVANASPDHVDAEIGPLPGANVDTWPLSEATLDLAMRDPFRALAASEPMALTRSGILRLQMHPYGIVRVDARPG
jgi:hypothetical protein